MTLNLRFPKINNLIKKNHFLHEIRNKCNESTINCNGDPDFLAKEFKDLILEELISVVE